MSMPNCLLLSPKFCYLRKTILPFYIHTSNGVCKVILCVLNIARLSFLFLSFVVFISLACLLSSLPSFLPDTFLPSDLPLQADMLLPDVP